jgi:hypothetical protein
MLVAILELVAASKVMEIQYMLEFADIALTYNDLDVRGTCITHIPSYTNRRLNKDGANALNKVCLKTENCMQILNEGRYFKEAKLKYKGQSNFAEDICTAKISWDELSTYRNLSNLKKPKMTVYIGPSCSGKSYLQCRLTKGRPTNFVDVDYIVKDLVKESGLTEKSNAILTTKITALKAEFAKQRKLSAAESFSNKDVRQKFYELFVKEKFLISELKYWSNRNDYGDDVKDFLLFLSLQMEGHVNTETTYSSISDKYFVIKKIFPNIEIDAIFPLVPLSTSIPRLVSKRNESTGMSNDDFITSVTSIYENIINLGKEIKDSWAGKIVFYDGTKEEPLELLEVTDKITLKADWNTVVAFVKLFVVDNTFSVPSSKIDTFKEKRQLFTEFFFKQATQKKANGINKAFGKRFVTFCRMVCSWCRDVCKTARKII